MTIKLNSFGGGGGFSVKFASNGIQVSTGATGTYITLTPPSGQKVRVTLLSASGSVMTSLTTVSVGGSSVVIDAKLKASGQAAVLDALLIGGTNPTQEFITGGIDEVIEVSTNVSTSQGTDYAYQFGV